MKTRPMLTLDDCRKISAAAEAEAKKKEEAAKEAADGLIMRECRACDHQTRARFHPDAAALITRDVPTHGRV